MLFPRLRLAGGAREKRGDVNGNKNEREHTLLLSIYDSVATGHTAAWLPPMRLLSIHVVILLSTVVF